MISQIWEATTAMNEDRPILSMTEL